MQKYNFNNSIIVGVDVHKRSHQAVILDNYGQVLSSLKFGNSDDDYNNLVNSIDVNSANKQVFIGLEDIGSKGYKLFKFLSNKYSNILHVPSIYTEQLRTKTPHTDKDDFKDAKGVAKVILLQSDSLPQVMVTQDYDLSKELKGLIDDREGLVKQQSKLKNQLHELFHKEFGDNYNTTVVSYKDIFAKKALPEWLELIESKTATPDLIRIKSKILLLQTLVESICIMDKELERYSNKLDGINELKTIPGCGTIIACKIIAEIKDISRFRSSSSLAKYCGIAPISHSSGTRTRFYTDKRGNRRLNTAIHLLALSQIGVRGVTKSREYYKKKQQEGKSKLHSLRCLKRQLVNIIFNVLKNNESYKLT